MDKKILIQLAKIIKEVNCKDTKKSLYENIGKLAGTDNKNFSWHKWNTAIF